MKVINKSSFFLFAGFLVSTVCLSGVNDLAKLTPTYKNNAAANTAEALVSDSQSEEAEEAFQNAKLKIALSQLRQNVNSSTSDLLASTVNN